MLIKKGKKIICDAQVCKSMWSKGLGLMFSLRPRALLFIFDKEQKAGLHMFFVFFPIDVVFMDKDWKIVEIKENFRPWTLYNPKKKAQFVLELPTWTVEGTGLMVGDELITE